MRNRMIRAGGPYWLAACIALAACASEPGTGERGGSAEDFAALADPCRTSARLIAEPVAILAGRRTGRGPALVLTAGDTRYICRRVADGSVGIFAD
ncbi:hypothetical protein OCH239_16960 [Roseivivax halodurans JCM 10272]|uniref:Lipoprotein n=1 Tax=Roseivivax halodurans JCM 10272 TaxID=1449350 RepID=X7EA54_9RHOB|nr:hypothetical protein [Roseivivax halodurans]ETX12822.1 hypothetical protein OCH239_16960 [Roseivivax halodurans JCM 10272]